MAVRKPAGMTIELLFSLSSAIFNPPVLYPALQQNTWVNLPWPLYPISCWSHRSSLYTLHPPNCCLVPDSNSKKQLWLTLRSASSRPKNGVKIAHTSSKAPEIQSPQSQTQFWSRKPALVSLSFLTPSCMVYKDLVIQPTFPQLSPECHPPTPASTPCEHTSWAGQKNN